MQRSPVSRPWCRALAAVGLVTLLLAPGCGQKMDTELPDLATKKGPPGSQPPLTSAQQKKAIDDMIAKRDGKAPEPK